MADPIAADDFTRHVEAVLAVADRVARRHGEPTEFELLTAVVFRHFAEAELDVALVEVGLGGRLDATHAWDGGVAVVTNVDLDHTDRLGPTIAAIAREKAAIIERGDLAVTGATARRWRSSRRRARRMGVPLTVVRAGDRCSAGTAMASRSSCRASGRRGSGCAAGTRPPTSRSPTRSSTRSRRPASRRADADARRARYATAVWPGRLELLDGRRPRRPARRRPQPGRRGRARPGARRPAAAPRARAAHAGRGVDGRQGRRRRRRRAGGRRRRCGARRSSRRASTPRGRCRPTELAERWRARAPAPAGVTRSPTRSSALRGGPGQPRDRRSWPARSILSARSGRTSSTTRSCAIRPRHDDSPMTAADDTGRRPRPDPHRPDDVRAGASGPTSWASSTSRRTRSRATACWPTPIPVGAAVAAGPPDGRRGRRPARHRRRIDPAGPRAASTRPRRSAGSCRSSRPWPRPCPASRSASTRPSRRSPRPRSPPARDLLNDVWGTGPDGAMAAVAAARRRAARS